MIFYYVSKLQFQQLKEAQHTTEKYIKNLEELQ